MGFGVYSRGVLRARLKGSISTRVVRGGVRLTLSLSLPVSRAEGVLEGVSVGLCRICWGAVGFRA